MEVATGPRRIGVFGLGYVGTVTAACLADSGHEVVGVDISPAKVAMLNAGQAPILEPGVDAMVVDNVGAGRLRATLEGAEAVASSELLFVCVGTPSTRAGRPDTTYLERVCEEIGRALATADERKTVVLRSTVLPGVAASIVVPLLEANSGRTVGRDFGFCLHPEFLREGSAIADFRNPPKVVVGADDELSAEAVESLYEGTTAPILRCSLDEAAMAKHVDNTFHALKVSFANEIGRIARSYGMDSRRIMEIFCRDTQLNISTAYLTPGFAFGGSCLPKDLDALISAGRRNDVSVPLLSAIHPSNDAHVELLLDTIYGLGVRRVGVLGLSFKKDTDDVRDAPILRVIETLLGKGYEITIRDPYVSLSQLVGSNRQFLEQAIPHVARLLRPTAAEVISASEVTVVTYHHPEFDVAISTGVEDCSLIDVSAIQAGIPPYPNSIRLV